MLGNKFIQSLLLGSLLALAFAPFYILPFAAISLSFFYLFLEEENNKKRIFLLGFAFGFGFFLAGNYWICISLLVDAQKFAWLIPFALTLIPSALALYFAMFALLYKFAVKKFHLTKFYQKILVFAFSFLFCEILRANLFTGFPWNLLGYTFMIHPVFAQGASIFGIYGLSFFAVIFYSSFAVFFTKKEPDKKFTFLICFLFLLNLAFGFYRIDDKKIVNEGFKIRLVQANIKQEIKWEGSQKYLNLVKTISLSDKENSENIKAVIWSETSVPYLFGSDELLDKLKLAISSDSLLITGGLRAAQDRGEIWNSVFALDHGGVIDYYDKQHLVPFGEYIPLQRFLPFIEKITDGATGFSEGEGAKTISTKYFSFSPLICYEGIFSSNIIDKKNRPDLLVNVTNDAWFGTSSGPYQHLDMTRIRAIENGIPLARVANTGVTAFVDFFGRVVKKINLNEEGVVDVDFIKKTPPTIYFKYSSAPLILLLLSTVLFLIFDKKYKKKK